MMPSRKRGKSNEPPSSPSKDSLDALSKLIGDIFASLKTSIFSVKE